MSRSGCRGDIRLFISHIRYELTWSNDSFTLIVSIYSIAHFKPRDHRTWSESSQSVQSNFALSADCRLPHLTSSSLLTWKTNKMDTLTTHPSTAQQATAFTSPASLSFPGGAGDLTPPSEKDGNPQANGNSGQTSGANGYNGQQPGGNAASGNGVTPTTPAATPGASQGVSGIVPTLQ